MDILIFFAEFIAGTNVNEYKFHCPNTIIREKPSGFYHVSDCPANNRHTSIHETVIFLLPKKRHDRVLPTTKPNLEKTRSNQMVLSLSQSRNLVSQINRFKEKPIDINRTQTFPIRTCTMIIFIDRGKA